MVTTEVAESPSAERAASVKRLLAAAEASDGFRPVSDQFWADLVHPGSRRFVAAWVADDVSGDLGAYAQATSGDTPSAGSTWTVEIVVHPARRVDLHAIASTLLTTIEHAIAHDDASLIWLIQGPIAAHESAASALGFTIDRRIHQMRRSLPTGIDFDLVTRPFDATRDVDEWLQVNSRAFAWNPEQGSWTEETLRSRMDEAWFDPEGFLIHDRDGRMAGFCWTKVHEHAQPRLGEIYVIGVDPDFQGLGLGRGLTLAGLASLAGRGIDTGMLFVDAANVAAVNLYDSLGFEIHRTDAMYQKRINT